MKTAANPDRKPARLRRGLSREEAAIYVGISPSLLDRAIVEGIMPEPFRIFGRVLWDIQDLDAAVDRLTNKVDKEPADRWSRVSV